VTFDDALVYLAPHGGVPPDLDAVEVMNLAQKLWSEAHEDEWEQRAAWRALQTGLIESGVLPQSDTESQQRILTLLCLHAEPRANPSVERVVVMAETEQVWKGYPLGQPDHKISVQYLKSGWKVLREDRSVVAPTTGPILEAEEEIDDPDKTLPRVPVVSKQNTPTPTPAQAPSPQSEQAAPGLADSAHGTREAAPQAPAQAAESAEQHAHTAATTRQSAKREKKAEPAKPEFTPEGETLYQDWCSLFHVKIPRTKAIILAANDLYEPIAYWSGKLDIPRAEVLKRIMNWQYKNNANYYGEGRGVKLFDVHRDFEEWQSAAQRKLDRALRIVSTDEPVPTVSGRPRLDVPPEYLAMMMGATS